jgi:hypothetical protein
MYKLCKKLKSFKVVLKEKTAACYGDLKSRIVQARGRLDMAQFEVLDSHGSAASLLKERECLHAYVSITKAEEAFLKQKARNQWLHLGDQNSAYFHRVIKGRQARNSISFLFDEQGNKVDDIDGIKGIAERFYKNLLGTTHMVFTKEHAARIQQLISPTISVENCLMLERDVTVEEIKETIFSMQANKAPGPDGYTSDFFKAAWPVVGGDVVAAIRNFFVSGCLLKEVNATILTLVPKKPNPSVMGEFRSIACCNVLYKCITKILANRMLSVLDGLIGKNQSAFIPGRSIAENVLLAQELVRDYHRKAGTARCTMKVDIMKAYDSVNWSFLIQCLVCFGFPARFINWIKVCITSPRFSVSMNGTLVGYFKGEKGLRQGDPLSPYLFVIAMEVFSRLMADYTRDGSRFGFHHRCARLRITHLCFADDLLIFSDASTHSVSILKAALEEFEMLSGLHANPDKSTIFCAGISDRRKELLLTELGVKEGQLPVRCLGVPLISSRLSVSDCRILLDKIVNRINSWTSKNLSFAGRLQLLNSVLYSLQVYWASLFILPKQVTKEITQKFNQFLWNGKEGSRAKAKIAWDELCFPKKEGGLGLKNLEIWNSSSMMRHIWSLFARAGSKLLECKHPPKFFLVLEKVVEAQSYG